MVDADFAPTCHELLTSSRYVRRSGSWFAEACLKSQHKSRADLPDLIDAAMEEGTENNGILAGRLRRTYLRQFERLGSREGDRPEAATAEYLAQPSRCVRTGEVVASVRLRVLVWVVAILGADLLAFRVSTQLRSLLVAVSRIWTGKRKASERPGFLMELQEGDQKQGTARRAVAFSWHGMALRRRALGRIWAPGQRAFG